jgi:ArsR family transcriptional regulator
MPVALTSPPILLRASARFLKGLGDSTRLRILELLFERERTVGELVELLGLPQARVSTHLACLRWCGYVRRRKVGRRVWYQMADDRVMKLLELTSELARANSRHLATCTRIGPAWV